MTIKDLEQMTKKELSYFIKQNIDGYMNTNGNKEELIKLILKNLDIENIEKRPQINKGVEKR